MEGAVSRSAARGYIVPCTSAFRDRILALAHRRNASATDLARSVLLLIPIETVRGFPDPGGPGPQDREEVTIRSGAAKDRVLRRKPRLQLRLESGYDPALLRRALALALSLDGDEATLLVESVEQRRERVEELKQRYRQTEELTRLRKHVENLSSRLLPGGINSYEDALYVLGLPPGSLPTEDEIRRRFRQLAAIYHPDSGYGDTDLMAQLNHAVERLKWL